MKREVKGLTMTVTFNEDDVWDMAKKLVEEGKLVPVVHASWVRRKYGETARCSNCGEFKNIVLGAPDNYCPKCGAKMDGKEETNG